MCQTRLLLFCFTLNLSVLGFAQEESWYYLRTVNNKIDPGFETTETGVRYRGSDVKLANALEDVTLFDFKKTLRSADPNTADRMFFVRADQANLLDRLLGSCGHLFDWGRKLKPEEMRVYEPNDYGLSSTIGANIGLQADLSYLDFLGAPKAWYYTTGDPNLILGISDGIVDTTDADFKDKTTVIRPSNLVKGHGYSTAANAAAQGDNGHGIPGICYDCSIYSTKYGDFRQFNNLVDLASRGVKTINASWSSMFRYDNGERVIDSLFDQQVILIAAGGNKSWEKTKGEKIYYPAGYDPVISVAAGMYKHPNLEGNIHLSDKGKYYANDIRGYVGRSLGFKDNDTLNAPHVWPISTSNLNEQIDILAPAVGLISYGKKILNDTIYYSRFQTTSGATPLVTGTVALMRSLYPCLPVQQIEPIIKLTALNVDHLPGNLRFAGKYGAGMLQTGDAVELVFQLYHPEATATIDRQTFDRWTFPIEAVSKKVILRDMIFTNRARLDLRARKQIVLKPGTLLSPGVKGKVQLHIDTGLEQVCDLVLRDPSIPVH